VSCAGLCHAAFLRQIPINHTERLIYSDNAGRLPNLLNLNRLIYFTTVAETASFTGAGDRLGVAKAVVSHQVGKLEQELGVTLIRRTTRRATLTEEGRNFYERALVILRESEAAYGEISQRALEPAGTLRLTVQIDYGMKVVAPVIAAYLKKYPHMRVEASFDDVVSDLVRDEKDLGIRLGLLPDSSNLARRLGATGQVVVASPDFARSLRPDVTPRAAKALPWIGNLQLRGISQWRFSRGDETVLTELNPIVDCDKTPTVRACALAGAGLATLPEFTVREDIAHGRLVRIFADWAQPEVGIHAVYPPAQFRPAKVRRFVDLLLEAEKRRVSGSASG